MSDTDSTPAASLALPENGSSPVRGNTVRAQLARLLNQDGHTRGLHVYLDTSGSMTMVWGNHPPLRMMTMLDSMMAMLVAAHSLGVDLHFNSFSHLISDESVLNVSGKSVDELWSEFTATPTVDGGTDVAQVWNYINASPARQDRVSVMITDFEWLIPADRAAHPASLYYLPIVSSNAGERALVDRAVGQFCSAMMHTDPHVGQRLLDRSL